MSSKHDVIVVYDIVDKITPGVKKIDNETDHLGKTTEKVQNNFNKMGRTNFGGLTSSLTRMAGMLGVGLGIREVINTTAEFQKQQAVLNTMFGEDLGGKYFLNLKKQSEQLPASMAEVTDSFIKLNGVGIRASNDDLRALSDVASAAGKNVLDAAMAIQGGVTGEWERMKALNVVARVDGNKVTLMYRNQKTTIDNTAASIKNYIVGLGKMKGVAGASEKIMSSMGGVMSNIGDSFSSIAFDLGKELLPVMKKFGELVGYISSKMPAIINFFKEWSWVIKPVLAGIAGFMVFNKILLPMWEFIKAFKVLNTVMALNPVGAIITALAALGVLLYDLQSKFGGWGKLWTETWSTIKQSFETGFAAIELLGYNWYANFVMNLMRLKYIFKDLMSEVKRVSEASMLLVGGNYAGAMSVFNTPYDNKVSQEDILIQQKLGKELGIKARTFRDLNIQMEKNKANWLGKAGWSLGGTTGTPVTTGGSTDIGGSTGPVTGGLTELSTQSNVKNVTISVNKMIENFNINTTNLTDSTGKIREEIIIVLQKVIADASSLQNN